ncbi:MAG: hypothetical protein LBB82_00455 [Treponema sp.]|jgi:hypothetical protein|nr:hypothetical protein [Treponema sp.]
MKNVTINGQKADIILESETTLGEVMSGLDEWLQGSGQYLSGLSVDGKSYGSASLDEAFTLPLSGIETLDVITSSWTQLMFDLLGELRHNLERYDNAPEAEQKAFRENWEKSAASSFLGKNDPYLHGAVLKVLSGAASPLLPLIDERIREIRDPSREAANLNPLIIEIAGRMEDLNLDVQTGKDARAAETITLFSGLTEKIYRMLFIFKQYGCDTETPVLPRPDGIEGQVKLRAYMDEFGAALRELVNAYENRDIVLAGDLAEYELAPRITALGQALMSFKAGGEETPR